MDRDGDHQPSALRTFALISVGAVATFLPVDLHTRPIEVLGPLVLVYVIHVLPAASVLLTTTTLWTPRRLERLAPLLVLAQALTSGRQCGREWWAAVLPEREDHETTRAAPPGRPVPRMRNMMRGGRSPGSVRVVPRHPTVSALCAEHTPETRQEALFRPSSVPIPPRVAGGAD
jgi:hypothetical protein